MRPMATTRYKALGSELRETRRSPGATSFYKRESIRAVRRVDSVAEDLAANGISDALEPLRLDDFGDGSGHTECRTCRSCVECADCECRRAA